MGVYSRHLRPRLHDRLLADRRPVETRVERDDGVVFEMRGAGCETAYTHPDAGVV